MTKTVKFIYEESKLIAWYPVPEPLPFTWRLAHPAPLKDHSIVSIYRLAEDKQKEPVYIFEAYEKGQF